MAKILMNHHVLAVPDKHVSADFFINTLGFRKNSRMKVGFSSSRRIAK
jgi:hypothetical protein